MTESASGTWSASVQQALLWARACATLASARSQVTENELFLGLLLTHPDDQGEMWAVLDHFGLTARDLLPDDYPVVSVDSLERAAANATDVSPDDWSMDVREIVAVATSIGGTSQVVHVLSALLSRTTPWQTRLQDRLSSFGVQVTELASELGKLLLPPDQAQSSEVQRIDLRSRRTAGQQIGDWLDRRFPRRPAAMAGFTSDALDPESDFIGVGIEADAFAYLVASKALTPPLAIGLFGNWGSGKSFLMAKIRSRVEQLSRLASGNPSPELQVWANVAPIEFNAWQYVETDLWAALLHHIFDRLTPEARQRLAEYSDARPEAAAQLEQQQQAVEAAQEVLDQKVAAEEEKQTALADAEQMLVLARDQATSVRDALVTKALEGSARTVLEGRVKEAAVKALGEDAVEAVVAADRAARLAKRPLLRSRYWNLRRGFYLVAAAVVVPLVAWLTDTLFGVDFATWAAAIAAGAALVTPALKAVTTYLENLDAEQQKAEKAVDDMLTAAVAKAQDARDKAKEERAKAQSEAAEARRSVAEEEERRTALQDKVEQLAPGNLYREFLAGRSGSEDYRKRLSLVTTIHDDLKKLAELTRRYNADQAVAADPNAPPNRIVLYIDDLDRCPAGRVVEVLEAVHLLLAFELFVVIVAVDTRWLVSALPRALPALHRDEEGDNGPSPMDYIEKIFQIPFWVEPLDDDSRKRLLRGLLMPSVASPAAAAEGEGGTLRVAAGEKDVVDRMLSRYGSGLDVGARRLSITPEELAFLESLAPLMAATPRQVKRFVNTCQLLLAMAPPLSSEGGPPTERMAACFMAAVHDSMPDLAERVATASSPSALPATWQSVLSALEPDELRTEREHLNAWFTIRNTDPANHALPPFELSPVEPFLKRWDVIRRIRFTPQAPPPGVCP